MKITNYLSFTVAAMAMAAGSNAFAGVPGEGYYSASPTTFQLTATSQVEPSYSSSEESTTITDRVFRQRIGNAEILKMLKNEGVIESVTGWSIVFVASVEDIEGFYIKKDGKAPRNITEYVSVLTEEEEGFDVGYTTGTATESYYDYTETKTINFLSQIGIWLGYDGEASETALVFGAAKLNYTFTFNYYGYPEAKEPQPEFGPSPYNYVINYFSMPVATGILGEYYYSGYGDLISGRVTGTQGSPIEIYLDR